MAAVAEANKAVVLMAEVAVKDKVAEAEANKVLIFILFHLKKPIKHALL
jgi:hypothetical protein